MENSFFSANLMALGGQMAQAWQKLLESWWQGLLVDRDRLKDLARVLAEVSKEATGGAPRAAGAEDLARVVDALELIERRQKDLEAKVASLADNLSAVVTYLEQSGAAPTGGAAKAGEGEVGP
jgi:hypothetical protein